MIHPLVPKHSLSNSIKQNIFSGLNLLSKLHPTYSRIISGFILCTAEERLTRM